ncbi:MAG: 16S rRNA (guanine(966)-N(2))-methyltransferase RsmD [Clostridiales bacterium]|nr:16S rRNA (guanine(966)-N(2))-methyltransferase RsmD [Clostridiales bacterium]
MRVIAGKYKGKPLRSPQSDNIRPTGDKVKQALFTKLQFFVVGSNVLDLFCGSGALGIEALSRGANKVVFVDKDRRSIMLTKDNLKSVNENQVVLNCNYDVALAKLDQKFDLILVDPPYASGVYNNVLSLVYQHNLLSDNGYIVCEHPNDMIIDSNFIIVDQKRYGTVTLSYLQKNEKN